MLLTGLGSTMNLGIRIKSLRKNKNWSQLQLAERTSISRARIAQIETNPSTEVKAETMRSLANALDVTIEQLSSRSLFKGGKDEGLEIRPISQKVPIITWEILKTYKQGQPMQGEKWLGSPVDVTDNAFALHVEGSAMTSTTGTSFPAESIIFVNPDKEHKNGDKVVALNKSTRSGVFRIYINEAGQEMLLAQNPQYPTLNMSDYVIIGVVVGCFHAI